MKSYHGIVGACALFLGSGCATLHSVSVTNLPAERGRPVQARADSLGIFGIYFSNDFADHLPEELRRQCPKGKVTGIYSKYQSTSYVVVLNREVTIHGYCVAADAPSRSDRRPPAGRSSAEPGEPSAQSAGAESRELAVRPATTATVEARR